MSNSPPLGLRLGVEAGEVTLQDGTASNPIRLPFSEEAVNTPKCELRIVTPDEG